MAEVDLVLRFFLQIVVVLLVCKAFGWFGKRFLGQTQVVMEMLAGLTLGPSLFGLLAPGPQASLFPTNVTYVIDGVEKSARHPSMFILFAIAQLALVLYMFLVGMSFNVKVIQHHLKGAVSLSLAGIAVPLLVGVVLTIFTFKDWGLFKPDISLPTACLYFGAAMCITAFPVLARIIHERGIAGTTLGTLALGAGATDDVVAWSILAIVLAMAKGSWTYAIYAIAGGALFTFVVLRFGPKLLDKLTASVERDGELSQNVFATAMIVLFVGALFTDAIGIHAVFGAFLIGVAMPRGRFAEEFRKRVEPLTVGLLVPLFFVYTGLNTKVNLLNSPSMWGLAVVVILAAILSKGLGCTFAARASGEGWRESWALGTLMNTRGLMELIILNVGLQQGVITERLFTIMVLMAIITTLMASPIFQWIYKRHLGHLEEERVRTAVAA